MSELSHSWACAQRTLHHTAEILAHVHRCCVHYRQEWNQPRCPSTDGWVLKMWHVYTNEYHPTVKKKLNDKIWRKVWHRKHYSEIIQGQKNKYHMISLLCGISRSQAHRAVDKYCGYQMLTTGAMTCYSQIGRILFGVGLHRRATVVNNPMSCNPK